VSNDERITPAELDCLCSQERKRLTALRVQLIDHHPFWGHIMLQMQLVFQADLPVIAATDCFRYIWLNPVMTSKLPIRQLGFVVIHEICHSVFASKERRGSRDQYLWSCATDYAINRILAEDCNYEIPKIYINGQLQDILLDRRYRDWPAESIYMSLENMYIPVDPPTVDLRLNVPSSQFDGRHHSIDLPGVQDHGGIDVHLPLPLSPAQREKLAIRVNEALKAWHSNGSQGFYPGEFGIRLEPEYKHLVQWQRLLRQFVGRAMARDDYSLARPNKRYLSEKIIVPGRFSETPGLVVVALDTSGSMGRDLVSKALGEIAELDDLLPEVMLITADAAVHQVIPAGKLKEFLNKPFVTGWGGTSHIPVFEYIKKQSLEPDLLIGITDLCTEFPKNRPPYPVLWIAPKGHGNHPWGHVVEIDA